MSKGLFVVGGRRYGCEWERALARGALWLIALLALLQPRTSFADDAPPAGDRAEVLDFCYMPIKRAGSHSHKQRLVLFELAGRDIAAGPEQERNEKGDVIPGVQHHVMSDVGIDSHLRSVYLSTYLMKRFYTVEAHTESPPTLSKKAALGDQELIGAAGVDSFAAYSLACTDWVVFPRLVKKDASWQKVKHKQTVNGKEVETWVWQLTLVWGIEADVYKRSTTGFTLAATIAGNNGGLFGMATQLAELADQKDLVSGKGKRGPQLSKRPEPGCNPPLLPQLSELTQGMSECAKSLTGLSALATGTLTEEQEAEKKKDEPPPQIPSLKEAAKGAALKAGKPVKDAPKAVKDAAGVAKESEVGKAVEVAEAAMTEEERAAIEALGKSQAQAVVDRVLALEASAKNSRVIKLVASVKGTWGDCKKPVDAVKSVSAELREISQNPTSLVTKGLLGLASCAGIDLSPDMSTATAPGTEQRRSKYCENVDANVNRGAAAMNDVALCEGRVAMERATLYVQNETKHLDGIAFVSAFTPIPGMPGVYGIALGKDEGADRGDMYVAFRRGPDGKPERVAYGRIYSAGPGGDEADAAPSYFKFRSGQGAADEGTHDGKGVHLVEHAQVGVPLGVRPQVSYYLLRGDLKTKIAYGGAIEGGYNASKFVPVADEVWARALVSFAAGAEKEMFATIELSPEVVHYLGGGLAAYGGAGFAVVFANKSVDNPMSGKSESLSGRTFGALLNLGLDYSVNPDWNARLSVGYRQGVGSTKLQNDSKTMTIDAGSLSAAHAGIAAGYTF
ncbi:MAG: hypothetical protein ABW061_11405 [Polyangiaceae bacterium]